jgi:hypothetical protein
VFTIAYGDQSDLKRLQEISLASRGAAYDAVNAATIETVFADVISNF